MIEDRGDVEDNIWAVKNLTLEHSIDFSKNNFLINARVGVPTYLAHFLTFSGTPTLALVKKLFFEKSILCSNLWLVIGTNLNIMGDAAIMGFVTIFLLQLREKDSGIKSDQSMDGIIVSTPQIGMALGVMPMVFMLDRFGRKACHLSTHVPIIAGWIIMFSTSDINIIIIARFIQGIGAGMRILVASVVVGECTSPKYRGFFLSGTTISISSGFLYTHVIGTFFSWRVVAAAALVLTALSFIILITLPNSPTWLIKVGRINEAYKAFRFYRGSSEEALSEFQQILKNQNEDDLNLSNNSKSIVKSVLSKQFYKPFGLMMVTFIAYMFSGVYVLVSYTLDIISEFFESNISPYLIMIILDSFRLLVSIIGCTFVKRFKRRHILHFSAMITIVFLLAISACMYFKRMYVLNLNIILLISLLFYTVGVGTGLQNLPYVLLGEIFTVKFKAISSTLSVLSLDLSSFLVLWTAPILFTNLGKEGTFLIYASIVFICWIFLYFMLPETKDKTLVEIENSMKSNKRIDILTEKIVLANTEK